ncbi:MAG: MerR family transcriptional regulator [Chloroflexi bacterium]|nr:MerR family transcriptional regulator [Chloroflexota bacterium]
MPPSFDDAPTYNLKAVVKETGLKPDTLRAWERRYGLPLPARTSGRHRLYSQQDIAAVKWLITRQTEGMSISRAVKLWQQFQRQGVDPFVAMPVSAPATAAITTTLAGENLDALQQTWIDACRGFNEAEAEYALAQAAAQFPLESVLAQVLLQGLVQIGSQWHANRLTVQQEHFASALAARWMHRLMAVSPPPTREQRLVVCCPPGEQHSLGALALSLLLRRRGWQVIYLGADVPIAQLQQTLAQIQPQLLVLNAQRLPSAAMLNEISAILPPLHVTLAYGGGIFVHNPQLQNRIGGLYLGDTLMQSLPQVETWLAQPTRSNPAPILSPGNALALAAFSDYWPAMLSQLRRTTGLPAPADTPDGAAALFSSLAADIAAALKLNDINLAAINLPWLLQFLRHRHIPIEALATLLQAMQEAAAAQLDAKTPLISDWLARIIPQYTPHQRT